jgi:hypothetical protein
MLAPSLPAFATLALELSADAQRAADRLRAQEALVRTLMDHIPSLEHTDYAEGLRDQLAEEESRLSRFEDEASSARFPFAKDSSVQPGRIASATESSRGGCLSRRETELGNGSS